MEKISDIVRKYLIQLPTGIQGPRLDMPPYSLLVELEQENQKLNEYIKDLIKENDRLSEIESVYNMLIIDRDKYKEELQEYKDDIKNIMNEDCSETDDRKHCSCVPSLRKCLKSVNKRHLRMESVLYDISNADIRKDIPHYVSRDTLILLAKNTLDELYIDDKKD